ncbi:MAG TPA: hypothetical protein VEJ63_03475 [Planctomycetota bacterium]|nr:hypothetical protein [Planctomycetota bacterium]
MHGRILLTSICLIAFFTSTVFGEEAVEQSMTETLLKEAAVLKEKDPDQWKAWDEEVKGVLAEHAEKYAGWMKPYNAPDPDIGVLDLPLPYLIFNGRENADGKRFGHLHLAAIIKSSDKRRVDVVLELTAEDPYLGDYVADAMVPDRADGIVRKLLATNPKLTTYHPIVAIAREFAPQLAAETRTAVYDAIRKNWNKGPSNGDGERYWRVLLELDLERGRREIIPFYGKHEHGEIGPKYDFEVIKVLGDFASPSREVADAARKWLKNKPKDSSDENHLRILLVRSDPENELGPFVEHVRSLVKDLKQTQEEKLVREIRNQINTQLRALVAHLRNESADALREFLMAAEVDYLSRFKILGALVKSNHPQAEQYVRKWMDDPDFPVEHPTSLSIMRTWVRWALPDWGDLGKKLAHEYPEEATKPRPQRWRDY